MTKAFNANVGGALGQAAGLNCVINCNRQRAAETIAREFSADAAGLSQSAVC